MIFLNIYDSQPEVCWLFYSGPSLAVEASSGALTRDLRMVHGVRSMPTGPNRTVGPWPNVTLDGNGMSCVLALPDAHRGFYRNSRFDWGSMVGTVTLPLPDGSGNITISGDARSPAGFVTEFGCGGSGALCPSPPSSPSRHHVGVTNGVLGFGDAGKGGDFLKIGVGKLRRPTAGRGGTHYETTWPYELAEAPRWEVHSHMGAEGQGVMLEQNVQYKRWGWGVRRRVDVCEWPSRKRPAVCMDTTLTNRGEQTLRTPFCSHNLFSLAGGPSVGPGFAIDLPSLRDAARQFIDLGWKNTSGYLPFNAIAKLSMNDNGRPSRIAISRQLRLGEMSLAAFNVRRATAQWDGRYEITLPATPEWRVRISHSLQAIQKEYGSQKPQKTTTEWYQFTLQVTKRAISPRLCTLIELRPTESIVLNHRVGFSWERSKRPPKR